MPLNATALHVTVASCPVFYLVREAGGGLMVAVIQLAITTGAAGGGVLFDSVGYQATFLFSAVVLCLSASVILVGALGRQPESSLGCETCGNAVPPNL